MSLEQYNRDRTALSLLLFQQQKSAELNGYEAAYAAGHSQSWWSKVVNGKLMPDFESIVRFLEVTEAPDDVVSMAKELFKRLDDAALPSTGAVHVHKLGSDRWHETLHSFDAARGVTVVNPSRLPVELCDPAGPLRHAALKAEQWRGMGRKNEVRTVAASLGRQYVFLISEAAILSVFGLDPEDCTEQLQHLSRTALHGNVAIQVVPLCARVVVPSPLAIADSSALLAYAPGGVVISDDTQRPYEDASRAVQAARAHAVSQKRLIAWLAELTEDGRPPLLSCQR